MKILLFYFLFSFFYVFQYSGQVQVVSVSGFVKNQYSGEANKEAAVFEAYSGVGTITNSDGYYRLLLNPGKQKLEITSPGYDTFEVTFNLVADTIVSVDLVPHEFSQVRSDADNKGSVESVTAPESEKDIVVNKE